MRLHYCACERENENEDDLTLHTVTVLIHIGLSYHKQDSQGNPMEIAYLADQLHFLDQLAAWHHAQWGHLSPEATVEKRLQQLIREAGRRSVPAVFVAFDGEQILGSASLVVSDLRTRPALTPWLASVYVAADFRQRGIGSALVTHVMAEAQAIGVETLYLITPDQQSFYARLGWSPQEEIDYRGERVTLMSVSFD